MINKKLIAKEWLLILFSILFGHFILAIFIAIIDPKENLGSIYAEIKKTPEIILATALYFYLFVQLMRSIIWSLKQFIKK